MPGRRDDAVGALASAKFRVFLDTVDRHFTGTAEHRENRTIFKEIDGIVTPFAGSDFAAIKPEKPIKLAPVEGYFIGGDGQTMVGPPPHAWVHFCRVHTGPPLRVAPKSRLSNFI